MAISQILTGARAKVFINGNLVGLFASANWSIRQDKTPVFILGRYNPADIVPTAQEAVTLDLTGYRVIGLGPYVVGGATLLQNLLNEDDFNVALYDRQTGSLIFNASGCRVTGWSSGVTSRGISDLRLSVVGIVANDESAPNGDDDSSSAANLLDD
jgi:hypothetical protein